MVNSNLSERPVRKLPHQGNAKAGGATVRPPEKTGNHNEKPPTSGLMTKSTKSPGSGTRGTSNGAGNKVSRT